MSLFFFGSDNALKENQLLHNMFFNRGGRENNQHLTGTFVVKKWPLPLLWHVAQGTLYDMICYKSPVYSWLL